MIINLIPAYNEEKSIAITLNELQKVMREMNTPYKIIVIDDGSSDDTKEVLKKFMDTNSHITAVHFPQNQGVGIAIATAFAKALEELKDDDILILLEADRTTPPQIIPQFVAKIKDGYQIVIASRYGQGGGFSGFPPIRFLISLLANKLLKFLFSYPQISDYTIFFRAYKGEIIKRAKIKFGEKFIDQKGFAANAEILLKLLTFKPTITEIGFTYPYSLKKSESKLKVLPVCVEYILLIFKMLSVMKNNKKREGCIC